MLKILFLLAGLLLSTQALPTELDWLKLHVSAEEIDKLNAQGIKIIDIRKEHEWLKTGVVDQAINLTFLLPGRRQIDPEFIKQFPQLIAKDQPFAIICNTQSRTSVLAGLLAEQGWTQVIQLTGGAQSLIQQGYSFKPYQQNQPLTP